MKREPNLNRLRSGEIFDLLIVGGGATGLGAAVDAAARGHRVALIEQDDFAKGTSSRSTKLVHGGVRYLRQGNVPLVLEALRERGRLARNAPHLVHDLAFVIPTYSWWEGPFYGVGMKVYDHLAGNLGLEPSRVLNLEDTVALIPTIERKHLVGGVVYHDGQFDDARLAVNLAQTACELGAAAANYCACAGLLKDAGMVSGVLARDAETGAEFEIRARGVINATGVFVDALRRMDDPGSPPLVAASQGIHLVLPKEFLPGDAAIMIPKTEDGRVLFAVPWHDRVIVGTTDTPRPDISLEPRALAQEREFVMDQARRHLARHPRDEDVLSVYAGLRPLVKSGGGNNTAALSREHSIVVGDSGLVTITGGKWTTYRRMAKDVVDCAETVAGLDARRARTQEMPIHGCCEAVSVAKNLRVYGSDAPGILRLMGTDPSLSELLHPRLPVQCGEVVWQAQNEMARTVEDVLARRTRALLLDARASIEAAPIAAGILARELGYGATWIECQVEKYATLARGYIYTDPSSTHSDRLR